MTPDQHNACSGMDSKKGQRAKTHAPVVLPTSFLYVPGSKSEFFQKAMTSEAGAVIIDLEDSVPSADKAVARDSLSRFFESAPRPAKQLWVRINHASHLEELQSDLRVLAAGPVTGILVPKVEHKTFAQVTDLLEADDGLRELQVIGLIETAVGLLEVVDLARQPRIVSFGIGRVDLFADLRAEVSEETQPFFDTFASQVVLACAAAGISAPVAPVMLDLNNMESIESSLHYSRLGFRSRTAIHPGQCSAINSVFTPTQAQYREAQRLLEDFANSEGTLVSNDGQFIDEAVVRHARETVERYSSLAPGGSGSTTKEKTL